MRIFIGLLLLVSLKAAAAEPSPAPFVEPKRRVIVNNLLVLRLNPVGVEDQLRFAYQQKLLDKKGILFRDTFWLAGIAMRINPAFIKIGPTLELQPLAMLNLKVSLEYVGFFSSFGMLQSFGSPLDTYSDRALHDNQDAHRNYAASGLHLMFEPMVQVKLGPVALRNKLSVEYWYVDARGGDTVFYDVTLDTLVPTNGWVIANDLDLLYIHPGKRKFVVGARYSVVKPIYTEHMFRFGENRDDDNQHQRLGPLFAYTFFDRGYTRFNKPSLVLIVNWYVDHRYRTGRAETAILPSVFVNSTGVPYVVLAFAFQSDLLK